MIRITVGGERREIAENTTVEELLAIEHVEMPEYISVSVNEEFVLRADFNRRTLNDGDEVEFLYYMGGGALPETGGMKSEQKEMDTMFQTLKKA